MFKINYGDKVINVPGSAMDAIKRADAKTLRALLIFSSHPDEEAFDVCSEYGLTRAAMENAQSFWQGAGVLDLVDDAEPSEEENTGDKREAEAPFRHKDPPEIPGDEMTAPDGRRIKLVHADFPIYSSDEITKFLQENEEKKQLIMACEQELKKTFSAHEVSIIIGLSDYLNLDDEFIFSLVTFVAGSGKKSLTSVKMVSNLAYQFVDEGINTPEALHEKLLAIEKAKRIEEEIRQLYGIGARSLTEKEKSFLEKWVNEYKYGMDQIKLAFEENVNSTGNASFPYTDAILKSWFESALQTPEEIRGRIDSDRSAKTRMKTEKTAQQPARTKTARGVQPSDGSSFDSEDFLTKAIQKGRNERKR